MTAELKSQGDPRVLGRGDIFDRYTIAIEGSRGFYDRFKRGENPKAGWVSETDFEKKPIK
jgi:hypothetical protein